MDVEYMDGQQRCRAELKICHTLTPAKAIREALGQLLEYNYYGQRATADRWVIVLDDLPSQIDLTYLRTLTRQFRMPLVICWKSGAGFHLEALQA